MVIAWRDVIRVALVELIVFELHFVIPFQVEVSIGRARTLSRTVVAGF